MGEKFTSRVGYLIRNFRIASDMTQKELAEKCGLNESTIRNYELGNRYPDEATLLSIANNLGVSFYALSDPDVANIFSALHVLFDIEWAYGLRPTMKDGEICFKFKERLPSAGPRPQEDLNNFRKMVEYWARLRDKLEDEEISETEYYLKEVKYPMNPTDPNKEYTVSLNLDDDDQLLVQNMDEYDNVEETAELLKDLFPDFSYVKRKRKPKKEQFNHNHRKGFIIMRRFIYLDTDTLNSYIAQIYDGLVQTQETETQSSQATDKQSEYTSDLGADADLKVFGKGIEGKMDFTYRHLKETSNTELISDVQTKLLHDNAFDQLMNYLNKNEHLSNHNIGDFIEINDEFYIMDLDYYKKIFNDKKFLDFMKKNDRDKIQALLKIQQDIELDQEGANSNEIKKIYTNLTKSKCAESDKGYDDTKDIIEMLCTLVPYRRTLCIADNMVVLNDKYMRDSIDMTSFKFGGKIKVLGYITNKITTDTNDSTNISPLAQVGIGLNQIMLSFFGQQSSLNIVHPIAIYYE